MAHGKRQNLLHMDRRDIRVDLNVCNHRLWSVVEMRQGIQLPAKLLERLHDFLFLGSQWIRFFHAQGLLHELLFVNLTQTQFALLLRHVWQVCTQSGGSIVSNSQRITQSPQKNPRTSRGAWVQCKVRSEEHHLNSRH